MDDVADGLFVGTLDDAGNLSRLCEYGIENIVSLIHAESASEFPSDLTVVNVPMRDGPCNDQQKFQRAVTHALYRLNAGEELLVHCSAGASRSPAVAATALALSDDMGLEVAFEQIADRRDAVDPHEAVVQQAARVYTQNRA